MVSVRTSEYLSKTSAYKLNPSNVINGVRFQLSALLDLKKKAIQGAFFVHD